MPVMTALAPARAHAAFRELAPSRPWRPAFLLVAHSQATAQTAQPQNVQAPAKEISVVTET